MRHEYDTNATSIACEPEPASVVTVELAFTLSELQSRVSQFGGKKVSRRTLERWVAALGMERNRHGLFELSDLSVLTRMAQVMRPGRKLQQAAAQVRYEFLGDQTNASEI